MLSVPSLPIGVFDSGMGGLTVLRALKAAMPSEDFVYLGDTARLPYGTKSPATVSAYACQAAGHLVHRGVKALVVACNTASAFALSDLRELFGDIPVILGPLILVTDHQLDWMTGRMTLEHARQDFDRVRFTSLRRVLVLARFTPVQPMLNLAGVNFDTGRTAIDGGPQSGPVTFTPCGNAE